MAFVQLKGGYLSILKLATSDDSASGGLTPQQKVAALTPEQQAWLEANARAIATLLNTIHPATVPEPPAQ